MKLFWFKLSNRIKRYLNIHIRSATIGVRCDVIPIRSTRNKLR